MFASHNILTNSLLSQVLKYAYDSERKLSKHTTASFTVTAILDEIGATENLAIRISGHLILGTVTIYVKQLKYLLDDCNSILALFSSSRSTHKKARNNMLAFDGTFMLSELADYKFDKHYENDLLEECASKHENSFYDFGEIEMARNGDESNLVLNESAFNLRDSVIINGDSIRLSLRNMNEGPKRRKIIDEVIECDSDSFRIKTRSRPQQTFNKETAYPVYANLNLPREIISFLDNYRREPIEAGRMETMMDHFEPNISEHSLEHFDQSFGISQDSNLVEEEGFFFDDLSSNETIFNFNDKMRGKDTLKQAKAFLEILKYCCQEKIECSQTHPFEDIICTVV